ncbi:MAG: hypothetical protein QM786_01485 [Breznakibacter sp.]
MDSNGSVQTLPERIYRLTVDLQVLFEKFGQRMTDTDLLCSMTDMLQSIKSLSIRANSDKVTSASHELIRAFNAVQTGHGSFTQSSYEFCTVLVGHLIGLAYSEALHICSPFEINNTTQSPQKTNGTLQPISTWFIILYIHEDILELKANYVKVFHQLKQLGRFAIEHSSDHKNQDEYWNIFVSTDQGRDAIEASLGSVKDNCKIIKIADYDLFTNEIPFPDSPNNK